MVPAACMLLWALLLSLESRAAGTEDQTTTPRTATTIGMQRVSFRFGGPARSLRSTNPNARTSIASRRLRVTLDDENDALATADRLAVPAAAELLSTVTGYSRTSISNPADWGEDGSLEEGVVDTKKTTDNSISIFSTTNTVGSSGSTGRFEAHSHEREIRLTTELHPHSSKSTVVDLSTLEPWSTPGSTPSPWPKPSFTAMPSPEDLRVVLLPWGPWHCHCKSGTMSRSRAGKLHGLSGRLRVGALNELRTEHRPCTYQLCACDRHLEECPLDSSLCTDHSCSSRAAFHTSTATLGPVHLRRRPILPPTSPSPSPALAFWKRVRIGLEDIWNSLSSVFTETQQVSFTDEPGPFLMNLRSLDVPNPVANTVFLQELLSLNLHWLV